MTSFNASKLPSNQTDRKPIPNIEPGAYPARLVRMLLLGVQPQRPFKGEDKPPVLELDLTYELLDEFVPGENGEPDEEKPRWISETFAFHSLKADKAKSTKRYYSLDPLSEFEGDWEQLLEIPCVVTVVNVKDKRPDVDRVYDKVGNVTAMRPKEAIKAPGLKNPPLSWNFYEPDLEIFNKFPEWLQTKIKGAVDYPGSTLESLLEGKPVVKQQKQAEKDVEEEEKDW